MYKGMHDDKGRLYVINSQRPQNHLTVQSGSYQQYIFCAKCDNEILGNLERYASNNLYRKNYLESNEDFEQIYIQEDMSIIRCHSLGYKNFKLFLLSLLWRASISTEAVFGNFKLSDELNEFLREAIFTDAIVDDAALPCVLLTAAGIDPEESFIAVDATRPGFIKFYINAFVYTFYWEPNKKDATTRMLSIGMDHPMDMMKVPIERWNEIRQSIIDATVRASKANLK
jgi:hypothetical protein